MDYRILSICLLSVTASCSLHIRNRIHVFRSLWLSAAMIRYVSREKRTADEVIEEKEKKHRRKRRKLVVLVFRLRLCVVELLQQLGRVLSSSSAAASFSLSLLSFFFLQSLCISISVCVWHSGQFECMTKFGRASATRREESARQPC